MRDDDNPEGRLRELLLDPGWSLPPWPDAQARIRRAARRQRVRTAGLAACTGAIAAAAVAVPLALAGGGPGTAPGRGPAAPATASHASATPSVRGSVATVLMPDVTGLTLEHAVAVIRSVMVPPPGITVRPAKPAGPPGQPSGSGTAETVVAQLPAPGARVPANGRITLEVSSGG
ncbi:MAG TPA: PASTA domain-containing protein [Streptosporangiaceae bacterium]|jgi:hypothetical protein